MPFKVLFFFPALNFCGRIITIWQVFAIFSLSSSISLATCKFSNLICSFMEWKRKADSENSSQIMNSAGNGCQVLQLVLCGCCYVATDVKPLALYRV